MRIFGLQYYVALGLQYSGLSGKIKVIFLQARCRASCELRMGDLKLSSISIVVIS
jgi:hypothetical protein